MTVISPLLSSSFPPPASAARDAHISPEPESKRLRDTFEQAVDGRKRALHRATADLDAAGSTGQSASAGARVGFSAAVYGGAAVGSAVGVALGAAVERLLGASKAAAIGGSIGSVVGSIIGGLTVGVAGAAAGAAAGAIRFGVSGTPKPDPTPVASLDLTRYQGTWFEVARYDNGFQRPGEAARAEYSLQPDGSVRVENTAYDPATGAFRDIVGSARVGDAGDTSRLRVSFVPPWLRTLGIGEADYWVLDLHPDYQYAVVGEPARRAMWVLSRTPQLDAETMKGIRERVAAQGFDPARLQPTPPFPEA